MGECLTHSPNLHSHPHPSILGRMSPKRGRRAFLAKIPTTIAAGLAAPVALAAAQGGAPPAQGAPTPPQGITADTLAAAQQVAGVSLPAPERESARPLVTRNLGNIEQLRGVNVPSETEPAFSFRPPRPKPAPRATRPVGTAALPVAPRTRP